jgi:hypothetical protein
MAPLTSHQPTLHPYRPNSTANRCSGRFQAVDSAVEAQGWITPKRWSTPPQLEASNDLVAVYLQPGCPLYSICSSSP